MENTMKTWIVLMIVAVIAPLSACGDDDDKSKINPNNEESEECLASTIEGFNICPVTTPTPDFRCPSGAPYAFEFDGTIVCAENPTISPDQRGDLADEGANPCEESDDCATLSPSNERISDCDELDSQVASCLEGTAAQDLSSACERASVAASDDDWADLEACKEFTNNGTGESGICGDIARCAGRALRVCNEFNDECYDIREGRKGYCDQLDAKIGDCLDEADQQELVSTCNDGVEDLPIEDFESFEECFTTNLNNGQCESLATCASGVFDPSDGSPTECTDDEMVFQAREDSDDQEAPPSPPDTCISKISEECQAKSFEEQCECYDAIARDEKPSRYSEYCDGNPVECTTDGEENLIRVACVISG